MRISIITPTYHTNSAFDQGPLLEETIKSVLNQKGNFELEYIIMDGCSTDSTLDVVKKIDKLITSQKIKPMCNKLIFKWFSEKDTGQSNAINKGFKMASGEVANWLCSHDILHEDALDAVVKFFEKDQKAKVVLGDGFDIDENGKVRRLLKGREFSYGELIRIWDRVYHKFYIVQGSVFYKKSLLDELGYLDEKNHLSMDYDQWLRFRKKYFFYYINKPLSSMRLYSEAKCVKYRDEQFKESVSVSKKYWGKDYLRYYVLYSFFKYFKYPLWKMFKSLKII